MDRKDGGREVEGREVEEKRRWGRGEMEERKRRWGRR